MINLLELLGGPRPLHPWPWSASPGLRQLRAGQPEAARRAAPDLIVPVAGVRLATMTAATTTRARRHRPRLEDRSRTEPQLVEFTPRAAATAKAELVEARINKDLAAVIERSDAKFEQINAQTNARFEASNAKLEAAIEKTAARQSG